MLQCHLDINECCNVTLTLMGVAMQLSSKSMSPSNVHQCVCHIVAYIKVYIKWLNQKVSTKNNHGQPTFNNTQPYLLHGKTIVKHGQL